MNYKFHFKKTIIPILSLLIGTCTGIAIPHYFNIFQKENETIDADILKNKVLYLEFEADRWMYYAHIYYYCLSNPQSALAKMEKKDIHQRYLAKALSTISFIYIDGENITKEDNLVLSFLMSQIALLFEEGKITKEDLLDPLGIDWIFKKYPNDSAVKTQPTLIMEYASEIFNSSTEYQNFLTWIYNKITYYKDNRKFIERNNFPYDVIAPWRLDYGWKKILPLSAPKKAPRHWIL